MKEFLTIFIAAKANSNKEYNTKCHFAKMLPVFCPNHGEAEASKRDVSHQL